MHGQSGTLYFSTVRGVVAVDPAQFGPAVGPPTVLIEEVRVDGKPAAAHGGPLSLPPGTREFEIDFMAFSHAKPEQIRFRYRLSGMGGQWVEVDRQRSVRFSHPPPGDYVFEVTAANVDGHWNETGTRLAFTAQPFYWQTTWAYFIAATLLAMAVAGMSGWVVHRRHRVARQEQDRFRLVVEASPNALIVVNPQGLIVLANAQAETIFGYEAGADWQQHPFRVGLLRVGLPGAKQGMQDKDPTIAELLKPQGYATAQIGKNHLGDRNEFLPTLHGFDEFFGSLYHLNAQEEPEDPDYPKNPAFLAKFGPRGVLDCKATDVDDPTEDPRFGKVGKQTINDTGPLSRKRMETMDDELAVRSSSGTTPAECMPSRAWPPSGRTRAVTAFIWMACRNSITMSACCSRSSMISRLPTTPS
jgi:hypothetical protein